MALNSSVKIDVSGVLTAVRDMGNPSVSVSRSVAVALASGTLANQADVIFADTRTVAASATDALDLIGGGLTDHLGTAFAPVKLKALLLIASGLNTNAVQLVRPATNGVPIFMAAGDGISLLPGAAFCWVSPNLTGWP